MFNEKLLKISLAFIVFLLIAGFITLNYLIDDSKKPMYTSSPTTMKVSNVSTDTKELNLDTIFINVRSEKYKILKTDIAFKMKNEGQRKALQSNIESVRNAVLQYLNTMDANGLEKPSGKERLKEELTDMIQEKFGYQIETIYIKNFLLSP